MAHSLEACCFKHIVAFFLQTYQYIISCIILCVSIIFQLQEIAKEVIDATEKYNDSLEEIISLYLSLVVKVSLS
jgi:high-affinity Fe2+/Pb2+ permease